MKNVVKDKSLVAFCGLYCGACKKYLTDKCPGCIENDKAGWCSVRSCCMNNGYNSCADCREYTNAMDCKKFNNFISKIFGFLFNSDRNACIETIKKVGYDSFVTLMVENEWQTIKKK
ncbi:MAG: DUF3795 domain-containing protein [Lentimicrobiaceae bacterium]|nr:DUF3795 domain-containing protein [Lentimicrobiaceae bacterium]